MENKILILGCNGMLGHMVSLYLKDKEYNVIGFARTKSNIVDTIVGDALNFDFLGSIINNYTHIVNCIGILNNECDKRPDEAILLNSYLPRYLEKITSNTSTKIIHISTDCVFSGNKGQYTEFDIPDGTSMYARTKTLGELNNNKDITIRTSIVGPDINVNGIGLFNWFMKQKDQVNGFTNVIWTGLTTLELSKIIESVIINNNSGLVNAVPDKSISKYELLKLLNKYFKNNSIKIIPIDTYVSDKSLINTNDNFKYNVPNYSIMIEELSNWIKYYDYYNYNIIGGNNE